MLEDLIIVGKEKVEQDKKYRRKFRRVQWGHFPILNWVIGGGITERWHLDKKGAEVSWLDIEGPLRQEGVPGVVKEEQGTL